jgi:hypothetical protein
LQIIKTAKLLQFSKLQFLKTAKLLQFCKLQLKHGQIIAILQIIKIPLYIEFWEFIKKFQIIAILLIAIDKKDKIIAIIKTAKLLQFCKLLEFPSIGNFCKFIKTAKLLQFYKLQFIKTAKLYYFGQSSISDFTWIRAI